MPVCGQEDDDLELVPLFFEGRIEVERVPDKAAEAKQPPEAKMICEEFTTVPARARFTTVGNRMVPAGGLLKGKSTFTCNVFLAMAGGAETTCTAVITYEVEIRIGKGRVNYPYKFARVRLDIRDRRLKTLQECEVCSPRGCTTVPMHKGPQAMVADFWPTKLVELPLEFDVSKTIGRFRYTFRKEELTREQRCEGLDSCRAVDVERLQKGLEKCREDTPGIGSCDAKSVEVCAASTGAYAACLSGLCDVEALTEENVAAFGMCVAGEMQEWKQSAPDCAALCR